MQTPHSQNKNTNTTGASYLGLLLAVVVIAILTIYATKKYFKESIQTAGVAQKGTVELPVGARGYHETIIKLNQIPVGSTIELVKVLLGDPDGAAIDYWQYELRKLPGWPEQPTPNDIPIVRIFYSGRTITKVEKERMDGAREVSQTPHYETLP